MGALAARHGLEGASHLSWAVRAGSGGSVSEGKSDGGESGAGGCILEAMRRSGCTGLLIVVARWYGGRHLGALRFRIYRAIALELASSGRPGFN